ncbi:MAG TPA: ATP-binding cassette domain-containing protein [Syntrophales bacterium]|nr:ATP-binding cassette domain-containing protein [Syntrophales bacterium]HPI57118.1 ATP-binding cassette domain-containing protein [Syntrophales bacterium]HPN24795.1 ATP-binding cassette domain-containing protein [Syntrophales bacterium]HQM30082.1 ATP-binding cassette domain-containing protein [Syntrophales bacterium]
MAESLGESNIKVLNMTGIPKKEKDTKPRQKNGEGLHGSLAKPVITLKDVTVRVRDRHILPGTSWEIRTGQNWAILGPNGSGKSSLARLLADDIPHSRGKIIRHGLNGRGIGYVSFELHEWFMDREERLGDSRSFAGQNDSREKVRETILSALETEDDGPPFDGVVDLMGIRHLLDRGTAFLSTGEMRRVLIARALLKSPRLLILDEPFGGVDATSRTRLAEALEKLMQEGIQVILVTNRLEEILPGITHVLCVKDCRIVRQGGRGDVLTRKLLDDLYHRTGISLNAPAPYRIAEQRTDAGEILVEMKNVTVRYGEITVLNGLDWVMRKGENWAVVGPNGSGKSTLLDLISGDNPQAYANEIYLFGNRKGSGETVWEVKEHIGMVSARLQLQYRKGISAFEVAASGLFDSMGLYRAINPGEHDRVRHWMDRLGLGSLSNRVFNQLSFGERRMVLIARAMVKSPRLLILDEPCEGLDEGYRRRVLDLANDIGTKTRTDLIFVTHYQREVPPCVTHTLSLGRQTPA